MKRSKAKDLTGCRVGRLCVASQAASNAAGFARWNCICDCGALVIALGTELRRRNTQSCGCLERETRALNGRQTCDSNRQQPKFPDMKRDLGTGYRNGRMALYAREAIQKATDSYIARNLFRGKPSDFPRPLLAAKRAQLQLHRLIKEKSQ